MAAHQKALPLQINSTNGDCELVYLSNNYCASQSIENTVFFYSIS